MFSIRSSPNLLFCKELRARIVIQKIRGQCMFQCTPLYSRFKDTEKVTPNTMGLLNIALVFVYLTVLDGEFSNTNAEREVTDNTIQTRLVLNEEMDLYAEVRALKEQIQNLTAQLHAKGKIPVPDDINT